MPEKNNDRRPATSQLNLLLRIIIGAYLLYITYDMRDHFGELAFTAAAILFTAAGIWLIVNSLRRMYKGDYDLLDNEGNIIVPDDLEELEDLDDELELLAEQVKENEETDDKE